MLTLLPSKNGHYKQVYGSFQPSSRPQPILFWWYVHLQLRVQPPLVRISEISKPCSSSEYTKHVPECMSALLIVLGTKYLCYFFCSSIQLLFRPFNNLYSLTFEVFYLLFVTDYSWLVLNITVVINHFVTVPIPQSFFPPQRLSILRLVILTHLP